MHGTGTLTGPGNASRATGGLTDPFAQGTVPRPSDEGANSAKVPAGQLRAGGSHTFWADLWFWMGTRWILKCRELAETYRARACTPGGHKASRALAPQTGFAGPVPRTGVRRTGASDVGSRAPSLQVPIGVG